MPAHPSALFKVFQLQNALRSSYFVSFDCSPPTALRFLRQNEHYGLWVACMTVLMNWRAGTPRTPTRREARAKRKISVRLAIGGVPAPSFGPLPPATLWGSTSIPQPPPLNAVMGVQLEVDVRMLLAEVGYRAREKGGSQRVIAADQHCAAQRLLPACQLLLPALEHLKRLFCIGNECLTSVGQCYVLLDTLEEGHAQLFLQSSDLAAQGRLRHQTQLSGLAKILRVRGGEEVG